VPIGSTPALSPAWGCVALLEGVEFHCGESATLSDQQLRVLYGLLRERHFRTDDGYAVPPPDEVTVEWSSRLTASAGICYPKRRLIRLSTHYHARHPDAVESTLLHEMIHLIVPGHGPAFYQWMERIRRQGGQVERYSRERAVPQDPPRWAYRCERCGAVIQRHRRLPHGGRTYRHKGCGGALMEFRLR